MKWTTKRKGRGLQALLARCSLLHFSPASSAACTIVGSRAIARELGSLEQASSTLWFASSGPAGFRGLWNLHWRHRHHRPANELGSRAPSPARGRQAWCGALGGRRHCLAPGCDPGQRRQALHVAEMAATARPLLQRTRLPQRTSLPLWTIGIPMTSRRDCSIWTPRPALPPPTPPTLLPPPTLPLPPPRTAALQPAASLQPRPAAPLRMASRASWHPSQRPRRRRRRVGSEAAPPRRRRGWATAPGSEAAPRQPPPPPRPRSLPPPRPTPLPPPRPTATPPTPAATVSAQRSSSGGWLAAHLRRRFIPC